MGMLVSERVGQFLCDGARLEYTEFGSGPDVVVLLHGQLMRRTMHEPLARAIAAQGYRVVTLDLLGHGRSDRPDEPWRYSMTAFGRSVVTLLDQLGIDRAVVGGTSLGANVSLEIAVAAPDRLVGMLLEMPVLDNALEAGIVAFGPLIFFGRITPWFVSAGRLTARALPRRLLPFWVGVGVDLFDQQPGAMAATVHGIFFDRIAPTSSLRRRIEAPALVVGHRHDPVHPAADAAMLADELPNGRFLAAESIFEWRARPERINAEVFQFLSEVFESVPVRRPSATRVRKGTMRR
jgi:pimeloyl-ACP methyl ester carboxylesterase